MKNTTQRLTFHHIMILISIFLIMFSGMGIIFNCSSLFIIPICDELGFSRSLFNFTFTIRSLTIMITTMSTGRVYQRLSIIKLMRVSVIIVFVSFFMMSFAYNIVSFYLLTIILGIAFTYISVVPASIIIQSWFKSDIGLFLGIVFMGSGVGGMVFNVMAGILIERFGWRITLKILAIILGISTIPTTFLFVKLTPAYKRTQPFYRETVIDKNEGEHSPIEVQSIVPVNIAILSILIVLTSFSSYSVMFNIAPYLVGSGFGNVVAASINSISMGALAFFKVLFGKICDSIGSLITTMICIIASIMSLSLLSFTHDLNLMYGVALLTGVAGTFGTVVVPIITLELLGKDNFSKYLGVTTACSNLGVSIVPLLSGFFFDRSTSYVPYFIFALSIACIALLISFFIYYQQSRQS